MSGKHTVSTEWLRQLPIHVALSMTLGACSNEANLSGDTPRHETYVRRIEFPRLTLAPGDVVSDLRCLMFAVTYVSDFQPAAEWQCELSDGSSHLLHEERTFVLSGEGPFTLELSLQNKPAMLRIYAISVDELAAQGDSCSNQSFANFVASPLTYQVYNGGDSIIAETTTNLDIVLDAELDTSSLVTIRECAMREGEG